MTTGGFTLPGQAGYEELTLELAQRWGADAIRDCDGTQLPQQILNSDYQIYKTICPVREHNQWIKENMYARQQTFLCSSPRFTPIAGKLQIRLLDGFFEKQFEVNSDSDAVKYMQVFDRTTGIPADNDLWRFDAKTGTVIIDNPVPFHQYTVSFLAWRVWEEISMYNHTTNNWDEEPLMQLNPYHPEALDYLKSWLKTWCRDNPAIDVVRFTSLFYNFAWIWGADIQNRSIFTDWGSYDFTVCTQALADFEKNYGYALCAEDFVRAGRYFPAHRVPDKKKLDWMDFIGKFVRRAGRELTDIVHASGKRAFVFYDDNWVGLEPYNGQFDEFGFDGIIKCVFSGYEVRLCAGVPVKTRELRFHPYLFPVGLGGNPTFSQGGEPGRDALNYWINVRRALLREPVERCGIGGYLNLAAQYPCFLSALDGIISEFRVINTLHEDGKPLTLSPRIAILTAWGRLRAWTLSGHFHETCSHALIHVLESLSGLPFNTGFISFDDIAQTNNLLDNYDIIINAGRCGDAWSGGSNWSNTYITDTLTKWVHEGGIFLGINEPSAYEEKAGLLVMSHVLGVQIDNGDYTCHGRRIFEIIDNHNLIPDGFDIAVNTDVMLVDGHNDVLAQKDGAPLLTSRSFGKGKGIYCADFRHGALSARFLQNLILHAAGENILPDYITDDALVESAYYPSSGKLALINNSRQLRHVSYSIGGEKHTHELKPLELKIIKH